MMQRADSWDGVSDEALAERAVRDPDRRAGELAASALLGRYRRITYRWCYRYVRDHEWALDLAQEALLSAYRHLGSFRASGRFVSWLYAITRNTCLMALRRPSLLRDEDDAPERLADGRPDPNRVLEDQEDEEALLRLIRDHLDPVEQEALWLRCFERLPVGTITQILRIEGASGARGLLQGARRKLRRALERRAEMDGEARGGEGSLG